MKAIFSSVKYYASAILGSRKTLNPTLSAERGETIKEENRRRHSGGGGPDDAGRISRVCFSFLLIIKTGQPVRTICCRDSEYVSVRMKNNIFRAAGRWSRQSCPVPVIPCLTSLKKYLYSPGKPMTDNQGGIRDGSKDT